MRDAQGKLLEMVRDQHRHRRYEAARRLINREAREYAESIVDTVRQPIVVLDAELRVLSASRFFYQFFKVKPEETEKQYIYDLDNRQGTYRNCESSWKASFLEATTFDDYEIQHDFPDIGKRTMSLNARKIFSEGGKTQLIVLAMEDITWRRKTYEGAEKAPGSDGTQETTP